jgi:hypothetical protein
MYTQNMATFDFTEEVSSLGDYLQSADYAAPITLQTATTVNPVNLITTLAHAHNRSLIVLRTDPTYQAQKYNTQVFNLKLSNQIASNLKDYASLRQDTMSAVDSQAVREN